jgi:hypothetical protein
MDEANKFAWAYLLTYGKLTNGKWCHYAGQYEDVKGGFSWGDKSKEMEDLREKVLSVGIYWDKTEVPAVTDESAFNDTESPNSDKLATLGKLILKNGESFLLGSSHEEAAHLAETAREMRKGKDSKIQELSNKL